MASEVSICSSALSRLGAEPILSLEDDSDRARLCKRLYPELRDAVLREHPWNFAMRRAQLGRLVDAPAFGWAYQYQLPSDPYCLRVWQLENDQDYTIEGRVLLTDQETAKIRYVALITDTGLFDPLFTEALTTRLSAEMAYAITSNATLAANLFELYKQKLPLAKGADGQEGRLPPFETYDLLEVR